MKIGIYGGTFDPIHNAHLIIAEHACVELALDRLYFMPSFIPPHKTSKTISPAELRLDMLKLAVAGNAHLTVSDYEIAKKGTSYTVDTLAFFQQEFHLSRDELYLILGADNFVEFQTWKAPEHIQQLARLVVAQRPNHPPKSDYFTDYIALHAPLLEISASMIRDRVRQGKSIRYLVPDSVADYIFSHQLYK